MMKVKFKKLNILFFFILFALSSKAQPVISLKADNKIQPIGKRTYFLQDAHFMDIWQVLQPEIQAQFQPYDQETPNFGSIPDAVWLKFTVAKEEEGDFYLQIGSAFIDSIALYTIRDGNVKDVQMTGDNFVFSDRDVKVTTFLLPLNAPTDGVQTYFLRLKTQQPFFFPLRVGTLKAFMEDTHILDFIQGIYFGFMLLIMFYNFFLYFSTKERIYLIYVAYVLSITWFMSTVYQYIFEFTWPDFPILNQYAVASSAMTMLTATVFTRNFLNTEKRAPRLHKISMVFIGMGILAIILLLTPLKIQALMLAQVGILLMAVYFLLTGIVVLRQGYRPAKFYLLAWGFLIFGFIAAILETVNVLPVVYYFNYMQFGSAVEVTLLSFALADRINLYKKQREKAQAEALKAAEEKAEFIQKQNIFLEEKVAERTLELSKTLEQVEEEKKKSDKLLLNILPYATALELKETGKATPRAYESVSVLFADFQGFSQIAEALDASELVGELDEIFQGFDEIVKRHGLEKIKTIGDAYMAAGGISGKKNAHPMCSVSAALEMQEFLRKKLPTTKHKKWAMRCGIHTGPVTAGVVGRDKFAYDIWGSTVNLAARMESNSEPGRVNISEATYQLVKDAFPCVHRGKIEAKNIGEVNMYYVESRDN